MRCDVKVFGEAEEFFPDFDYNCGQPKKEEVFGKSVYAAFGVGQEEARLKPSKSVHLKVFLGVDDE